MRSGLLLSEKFNLRRSSEDVVIVSVEGDLLVTLNSGMFELWDTLHALLSVAAKESVVVGAQLLMGVNSLISPCTLFATELCCESLNLLVGVVVSAIGDNTVVTSPITSKGAASS